MSMFTDWFAHISMMWPATFYNALADYVFGQFITPAAGRLGMVGTYLSEGLLFTTKQASGEVYRSGLGGIPLLGNLLGGLGMGNVGPATGTPT